MKNLYKRFLLWVLGPVLRDVESKASDLRARIDGVDSALMALQVDVVVDIQTLNNNVNNDVDNLRDQIGGLQAQISSLQVIVNS